MSYKRIPSNKIKATALQNLDDVMKFIEKNSYETGSVFTTLFGRPMIGRDQMMEYATMLKNEANKLPSLQESMKILSIDDPGIDSLEEIPRSPLDAAIISAHKEPIHVADHVLSLKQTPPMVEVGDSFPMKISVLKSSSKLEGKEFECTCTRTDSGFTFGEMVEVSVPGGNKDE